MLDKCSGLPCSFYRKAIMDRTLQRAGQPTERGRGTSVLDSKGNWNIHQDKRWKELSALYGKLDHTVRQQVARTCCSMLETGTYTKTKGDKNFLLYFGNWNIHQDKRWQELSALYGKLDHTVRQQVARTFCSMLETGTYTKTRGDKNLLLYMGNWIIQ